MNNLYVGLIGLLIGVIGTGIGSIFGMAIKKTNKISSFLLGLTGGFIMFIISFHLFPEAFYLGGVLLVTLGAGTGVIVIIVLEKILEKLSFFSFMKTSIILGIGIAMHNLPEGLALGSTLVGRSDFGFVLSLAMLLHNIPEGMTMAIPLSINRTKPWKILIIAMLTGVPTGIGAYLGAHLGSLSNNIVPISLAMAGGIMLYIVCDEIIPKGKSIYKGKTSSVGVVIGFILGIIIYFK